MLEDAFVIRDREALRLLFEDGAMLAAGGRLHEARGADQIARLTAAIWERERTYLADPRRILQARDTALILGERGINVVRRGADGAWRYAISLLFPDQAISKEEQ